MRSVAWVLLLASICSCGCSPAGRSITWQGKSWVEETSLRKLPADVLTAMGVEPIADRGQPFNPSDVFNGLPARRFLLAGIAPDEAIVAVERGGAAHHLEFLRIGRADRRVRQRWEDAFVPVDSLEQVLRRIPPP